MQSTGSPDRTGEILAHLEWIRQALEDLKEEAREDRKALDEHLEHDDERFALAFKHLNRIRGGLAVAAFLATAGAAWAALVG